MKKLFFCDIDGTILDGSRKMNEVSEKTRYALRELKRNGDYVFIASGRCRGLLGDHIRSLDASGYVLCNGAYAEFEGKEIFAAYFEDEDVEKIRDIVTKYDGFYIFETLDQMYVDSLTSPSFNAFMNGWGKALNGFVEEKDKKEKYLISMIGFFDTTVMPEAEAELTPFVDLASHKQFSSYDVNIKGINKGVGVKKVIEYLGIDLEDTYGFGDGINDLEMLQSVGHPVIVDNCVDGLRHFGFEETDDVLDDGFYNYLVANKLIKAL